MKRRLGMSEAYRLGRGALPKGGKGVPMPFGESKPAPLGHVTHSKEATLHAPHSPMLLTPPTQSIILEAVAQGGYMDENTLDNDAIDIDSPPTAALLDAMGEKEETSILDSFSEEQLRHIASTQPREEKIETSFDIANNVHQNNLDVGSEGYIYYTAYTYYLELVKVAKKWLKRYCKANGLMLSGRRELKTQSAGIKYNKFFNPFVYYKSVKKIDALDNTVMDLAYAADTSNEATLQAAYALGFANSFEYKDIDSKFHRESIIKIKTDPRYLETIRKRNAHSEYIAQIQNSTFVPKNRRDEWLTSIIQLAQEALKGVQGGV